MESHRCWRVRWGSQLGSRDTRFRSPGQAQARELDGFASVSSGFSTSSDSTSTSSSSAAATSVSSVFEGSGSDGDSGSEVSTVSSDGDADSTEDSDSEVSTVSSDGDGGSTEESGFVGDTVLEGDGELDELFPSDGVCSGVAERVPPPEEELPTGVDSVSLLELLGRLEEELPPELEISSVGKVRLDVDGNFSGTTLLSGIGVESSMLGDTGSSKRSIGEVISELGRKPSVGLTGEVKSSNGSVC